MKIHEKLRTYRIENGITQTHIASKLNKPPQRISALERGGIKLTVEEFEEICLKGLGVSPSLFFENKFLDSKN